MSFQPKRTSKVGRFCSLDCYYTVGPVGPKKATVKGPRLRRVRDHSLAPPSGMVAVCRLVLYDKIGPGPHPCHWCGREVAWLVGAGPGAPGNLIADHLDWDIHNNAPENLVPSCNRCNVLRTSNGDRMLQPGDRVVVWSGRPTKAVERSCECCGEKFLIPPSATKRGRGRFCSRPCARRKDHS